MHEKQNLFIIRNQIISMKYVVVTRWRFLGLMYYRRAG